MSRKLWILAAVLALSLGGAAFAAVENIKVSGDVTVYGVNRVNYDFGYVAPDAPASLITADLLDDPIAVIAQVSNLKVNADLTEDVLATVGVRDERIWGGGQTDAGLTTFSALYASSAYVTLKDILESPVTLKIGKQPIRLGSGLLVADPTTNRTTTAGEPFGSTYGYIGDLSPRKSFDGVVATVDLSPATLTFGYVKGAENTASQDDDTDAWVANAGYDFGNNTMGELYYVVKDTKQNTAADQTEDNVMNSGARVVSSPIENLTLSIEGCYQVGKEGLSIRGDDKRRSDLAVLTSLEYKLPDIQGEPELGVDYARFGAHWDDMWEGLTAADIANALFEESNSQVVGGTLSLKPLEDISLKLRYANFRLVEKVTSLTNDYAPTGGYTMKADERDLGNEIDLSLAYDYTEDVQVGLSTDWFIPGDAFDGVNDSTAFQALGTMKVSF